MYTIFVQYVFIEIGKSFDFVSGIYTEQSINSSKYILSRVELFGEFDSVAKSWVKIIAELLHMLKTYRSSRWPIYYLIPYMLCHALNVQIR